MKGYTGAALSTGFVVALVLGFILFIGWWLQENFGPLAPVLTVLAVCLVLAFWMGSRHSTHTTSDALSAAVAFVADLEKTRNIERKNDLERLRIEREMTNAQMMIWKEQAKSVTIDNRRVDVLANQKLRAIQVEQRRQLPAPKEEEQDVWVVENETAGAFQQYA